jgi:hypothetical protein
MPAPLPLPLDPISVLPWNDPLVEAIGHDPRSTYVENFWLGILGPSTTWLLRRLAAGFELYPDGFELDLDETAKALGLAAAGGRHSPFARALQRSVQFGMAQPHTGGLLVRRKLPPLSRRHIARLPEPVQLAHEAWLEHEASDAVVAYEYTRARSLARTMLQVGDDAERTERQLHMVGVPPRIAMEALRWAQAEPMGA